MKIDTSKPYAVVNSAKLSIKHFETEQEAKEYCKFLIEYHKEEFSIVKDNS